MTEMTTYDYDTGDRSDPRWYENRPEMHDIYTCTVWTIHLKVPLASKDDVLAVLAQIPEATGEYSYGDSYSVWGEATDDPDDRHLGFYFYANHANVRDTEVAIRMFLDAHGVGLMLHRPVDDSPFSTVSGDWSIGLNRVEG